MKSFHLVLCVAVAAGAFLFLHCSSCSNEERRSQKLEAEGKELAGSNIAAGSSALEWERVSLGGDEKQFRSAVAELFEQDLEAIDGLFECGPQQGIWVFSPLKNRLSERRPSGGLSYCTVSSLPAARTARISSVRGEFFKKKLCSVLFKFRLDSFDELLHSLEARFGKGEERKLKVDTVVGSHEQSFKLWKLGSTTWGLTRNEREVTLEVQDTSVLGKLPDAADTSAKTDLTDIGIGGSPYDLNLDDIPVPDAADLAGSESDSASSPAADSAPSLKSPESPTSPEE